MSFVVCCSSALKLIYSKCNIVLIWDCELFLANLFVVTKTSQDLKKEKKSLTMVIDGQSGPDKLKVFYNPRVGKTEDTLQS